MMGLASLFPQRAAVCVVVGACARHAVVAGTCWLRGRGTCECGRAACGSGRGGGGGLCADPER